MGTRGFITFVAGGVEKTAYKHNDSYPSGLGVDMLTWLRRILGGPEDREAGLGYLKERAEALRVVGPDDRPTPEDVVALKEFTNLYVGSQSTDDWYCLLRETQGDPGAMLKAGVIEDASDFPLDSLFAEYGYVVDADAETFEVYEGFQKQAHDKGRFAAREGKGDYFPVALRASWLLADLPDEAAFMAACEDNDE